MKRPVKLVGLGMGPEDLTPRARRVIASAQVLAGGARLLAWFPESDARRLPLGADLAAWLEQVARAAARREVVVLASGDPLFYGIGARLLERLGPAAVEVLPNLTAVQAAFARLKEPWRQARVVSLHGRRGWSGLWWSLPGGERVAVFTDPRNSPAKLARALLERGQDHWGMVVVERMGAEDEAISRLSLAEAARREFAPLNLAVLKRSAWPRHLFLGMPEDSYHHQAGLITKREVRAAALAALELRPGHTLWDLGAGSGAVGIEAGLLVRGGRVEALERRPERVADIKANRRRFGAAWLAVTQGEAPGALAGLPDPDRVFMGGAGPELAAVVAAAAKRLPPGGVMVASLVRLESLESARRAMRQAGLEQDLTQVAVSRGAGLAGGTRLEPLNPVWLLRGRKAEAK